MRVQVFRLPGYGWRVIAFYGVGAALAHLLAGCLADCGAGDGVADGAMRLFGGGSPDSGMTWSDPRSRTSVLAVGMGGSAAGFQDTFDHEKGHLAMHIARTDGIDPYGERMEYLTGEIGRRMFPAAEEYMCGRCRGGIDSHCDFR